LLTQDQWLKKNSPPEWFHDPYLSQRQNVPELDFEGEAIDIDYFPLTFNCELRKKK
jgi:hypothetical protein